MATRTETRFGQAKAVGTAATVVCNIPAATTANVIIHLANVYTAAITYTVFIADGSWDESGDPAGTELEWTYIKDGSLDAGKAIDFTGIILNADEYVAVKSSVASSLDAAVYGVAITA